MHRKKLNFLVSFLTCFALADAQDEVLREVSVKFIQNEQNILSEKIFVHTDKNFYLAGEIIWFKLYYTDSNNKPLGLSKVGYVEIMDREHRSVFQAKIALHEGSGNGSLDIPVSLSSGVYTLRAYTNWMKNFSAEYYFEKTITIINTLKSYQSVASQRSDYDIQFFPEGGNLVKGIESNVGFRIVDQFGKGADCEGYVIDQSNDTITRFQPFRFGLGHFKLRPAASGSIYRAVIRLPDTVVVKNIPIVYDHGHVMQLTSDNPSQVRVTVTTNHSPAAVVYLLVHSRQSLKVAQKGLIVDGKAEFVVEKNMLGSGISTFTVFDSQKQPVCERLYFIRPAERLIIATVCDRKEYLTRKNVSLSVSTRSELGKNIGADMSVSVYRLDSTVEVDDNDILSYLLLTSDLPGTIESPAYYFTFAGAETDQAIDNLMLTQGWRRFDWRDILQSKKRAFEFIPELKGHIVTGKVIDLKTGKAASGITSYLSVPGSRVQLYGSKSDSDGIVHFYTKDFYGSNEIVLQTDGNVQSDCRIDVTSPYSNKYSSRPVAAVGMNESFAKMLLERSVAVQVQNTFLPDKLKRFFVTPVDTQAFFGRPDSKYMLDDYKRFSTMEDVLREYVYEVLVRRQREDFRLIVADGANKIFLDNPLTLFNGVPIFETNKIMQYDPLKVKKIEVVKRKYFSGPLILNGIVNFITYQPDASMISDPHSVVVDYEGLQHRREFYSPVYETQEQIDSRLPDFRNVLYWSPTVRTDASGQTQINFYTSDVKGRFIVVLQGLTRDGVPGNGSAVFEVK